MINPLNMIMPLLITFILAAIPSLTRHYLGMTTLSGTVSDLLVAIPTTLLLFLAPRSLSLLAITLWTLVSTGCFELLSSMSRLPTWRDLLYVFDGEFISKSFSPYAWNNHLVLFGLGGIAAAILARKRNAKLGAVRTLAVLWIMLAILHASPFLPISNDNLYSRYHPIHWLFTQAFADRGPRAAENQGDILKNDLAGHRFIKKGKAKNVLIVVMEGVTGSYLRQSQKAFGIETVSTDMPLLSAFAEKGMVIPDYVAHSHQTIRGLYAMMCSDISKLSWSIPKATQLQNVPEKAADCFPNLLQKKGWATHYLQASSLSFMGKDRFMPLIGFETVKGLEWFDQTPSPFNWGVDDKTFFNGALAYIDALKKNSKPWFLTLLTVGTHQPYAVTEEYAAKFWSRRQASVSFLDEAVSHFLQELERKGTLKDTLVILTSDESHGSELGDWASSWITGIVFAPDKSLPRLQSGSHGLIDMGVSILDYLGLDEAKRVPGRSFFRKYAHPREMVSFTADKLRWSTAEEQRIECTYHGKCRLCASTSILGNTACSENNRIDSRHWINRARWLDDNLSRVANNPTYRFGSDKRIRIVRPWRDQWADNLVGAQYLDFPAGSKTQVFIKWTVHSAPPEGIPLTLVLKQAEQDLNEPVPELKTVGSGETAEVSFTVDNPKSRNGFSFHLLPGAAGEVQISEFTLVVTK